MATLNQTSTQTPVNPAPGTAPNPEPVAQQPATQPPVLRPVTVINNPDGTQSVQIAPGHLYFDGKGYRLDQVLMMDNTGRQLSTGEVFEVLYKGAQKLDSNDDDDDDRDYSSDSSSSSGDSIIMTGAKILGTCAVVGGIAYLGYKGLEKVGIIKTPKYVDYDGEELDLEEI